MTPAPHPALAHPIDAQIILRKRRAIRQELDKGSYPQKVRIAILGGSTTQEIKSMLDLFLRASGIEPTFYESEYKKYFEDVMFDNPALAEFKPEIIFIHTTWMNVIDWPTPLATEEQVEGNLRSELGRFEQMWDRIRTRFGCTIIQNNFDMPPLRSLGSMDGSAAFGHSQFVMRLNAEFAKRARTDASFIVNDIHYLSAKIGLDRWFDHEYWFNYKMAVTPEAGVHMGRKLAQIVGAIYGKTKKCLVLDLDNTLWGGVIGDDGLSGIKLGEDTALGEAYRDFQRYAKSLRDRGVLLAVCSKNELENAKLGFTHPDSILRFEDFAAFKANWNPKNENIKEIAQELNIGLDSLVFVDDNPMERAVVSAQLPMVAVPNVGDQVSHFAPILESEGYFETVRLVADDLQRSKMYEENNLRASAEAAFGSYEDFLASLDMKAEIAPFNAMYMERISQLINKTNQFNLTTKRYTAAEVEVMAHHPNYVTFFGRLADKFGDNGLISVVIGAVKGRELEMDTWLMSCRVLKRGMEGAMLDSIVEECQARGIHRIVGVYLPTPKNKMVADHYGQLGFTLEQKEESGATRWAFEIPAGYEPRNRFIAKETAAWKA